MMGKNLGLWAKSEANLKMKVVWNTSDKELGGEIEIFEKSLLFREIYVKYLEKNSIQV